MVQAGLPCPTWWANSGDDGFLLKSKSGFFITQHRACQKRRGRGAPIFSVETFSGNLESTTTCGIFSAWGLWLVWKCGKASLEWQAGIG